MNKEMDFEKYSEEIVSKRNRRLKQTAGKREMVVGPLPPTGVHKLNRKERDRRRNLEIKKALK